MNPLHPRKSGKRAGRDSPRFFSPARKKILARSLQENSTQRMTRDLQESEAKYRAIVNSFDGMVYICSRDYKVEFANKQLREYAGCDPVGKLCYRVLHNRKSVCPWCPNQKVFRGKTVRWELKSPKNGRWYHIVNTPVYHSDKSVSKMATIVDITGAKESQERLKRVISLQRASLEATADGMLVIDQAGKVEDYNEKFRQLWNIPRKLLEARKDENLLRCVLGQLKEPQKFLSKVRWLYKHPLKESFDVLEFKDGRIFERYSQPQFLEGKPVGRVWSFRDVTARKLSEKALKESEGRFRSLFESSRDCHMLLEAPSWKFFSVNLAALQMFKIKNISHFQTYEPWVLSPERQPDGRLSREKAREMIDIAMRKGSNFFEWQHQRGDGTTFPAEVLLTRIERGGAMLLHAVVKDISERKQAEAEIRENQRQLREIIDTVPHLICAKDAAGRFLIANRALAELYGLRHEQLIGKRQSDLHPVRAEMESFQREDREVLLTGRSKVVLAQSFTDCKGQEHFFRAFKVPFRVAGGEGPAVLVVAVDITEQKKEEEFRSGIVRTLSHELRTPLSIEKGGISLLLDGSTGAINDEQKMVLETVMRNINRLSRMIDNLLDISRLESGRQELQLEAVDLREIVRETVTEFNEIEKNRETVLRIAEMEQEAKVWVDKDRIMQVLINLIGNALKFTSQGSVEISIRVLQDEVECSIADTGVGITEDHMNKMFAKFQPLTWQSTPGKEGVGVGLAIVRGILDLHRGRIWAKSIVGKGTTVTFVLPRFRRKGEMTDGGT